MDAAVRKDYSLAASIEETLSAALDKAASPTAPPRLSQALRYAVFPGGARLRPRLCLSVAHACSQHDLGIALGAAAAIELLHCASLVHDDLPCFDDASERRGRPSLHCAFDQRIAVLAGDALIVLAFRTICDAALEAPRKMSDLIRVVSDAVGMPAGIVAGQARECEPQVMLASYHLEKTGALFAAATMAGAAASGVPVEPWRKLGERLGQAYQVADDICDLAADPTELGKPTGKDAALGRPSAALELGLSGALDRLDQLIIEATEAVPNCPGADNLRALIGLEARRFLPPGLARQAA